MKGSYVFLILGFLLLGGAIFFGGRLIKALPQRSIFSGLSVEALPESRVFLNGKEVGKTPFDEEKLAPGEYILRLMPSETASFSSWERKIKLNPSLLTYVNYVFGPTENESAGEILTLEKTDQEKGEIVALSDPDGASFSLDGDDQGITPKNLSGFSTGDHEINFSFPGYLGRDLKIKTLGGHKILVNVKLAKIHEEAPPPASESAGLNTSKVKILDTPTGWLRVRTEPSLSASEAAKVNPGEEYPLLGEEEDWLEIQYEVGKEGWISSQYGQKIGQNQPKP